LDVFPVLPSLTDLVQTLGSLDLVLGESPDTVLVLDQQVQGSVKQSVQAGVFALLILLCDSGQWPLHNNILTGLSLGSCLAIVSLGVSDQSLDLRLGFAGLVVDQNFVVPTRLAVCIVYTDITGRGLSQQHLALPFAISWGSFLVVEVAGERECETFVQSFLVEEEGFFEGVELACQNRRS
jgi:hypothetical protein